MRFWLLVSSATHLGALARAAATHGLDRGAAVGDALGPGGRGGRRRVYRALVDVELQLEDGELSLTRRGGAQRDEATGHMRMQNHPGSWRRSLWSALALGLNPRNLLTAPGIEARRRSACRSRLFPLRTSMVWSLGLVDKAQ